MRIAYHAESLIDAHLAKDALEQADIPAFVSGEFLTGGVGILPACDYVAVMVPDTCIDAAEAIMRVVQARLLEARAAIADDDPGDLAPVPG
jgi:Putative prokaryotic signal transducing protein